MSIYIYNQPLNEELILKCIEIFPIEKFLILFLKCHDFCQFSYSYSFHIEIFKISHEFLNKSHA
jgi:hypothetical protein